MNATINSVAASKRRGRSFLTPAEMFEVIGNDGIHVVQGAEGIVSAKAAVAAQIPMQTAHPLGPPTVSGTSITVDTMLNQVTRITRMISDLSL